MTTPKKRGGLPRLGPATLVRVQVPDAVLARIDQAGGRRNRSRWIREAIGMRLDAEPGNNQDCAR